MVGMFAISLAGHDKGQMYVIIKEDGEYFYLSDGNIRPLDKLKKKKKKHTQLVKSGVDGILADKLQNAKPIYNEEIKFAIKRRKQEVANV